MSQQDILGISSRTYTTFVVGEDGTGLQTVCITDILATLGQQSIAELDGVHHLCPRPLANAGPAKEMTT